MRRLFAALLALSLLTGCPGPAENSGPTSIVPLDKAKVTAAEMNMKTDPILASCNLKCSAENDLLVINGEVPTEAAKKKAEDLAKHTQGITKVANHIKVVAGPPGSETPAPF